MHGILNMNNKIMKFRNNNNNNNNNNYYYYYYNNYYYYYYNNSNITIIVIVILTCFTISVANTPQMKVNKMETLTLKENSTWPSSVAFLLLSVFQLAFFLVVFPKSFSSLLQLQNYPNLCHIAS